MESKQPMIIDIGILHEKFVLRCKLIDKSFFIDISTLKLCSLGSYEFSNNKENKDIEWLTQSLGIIGIVEFNAIKFIFFISSYNIIGKILKRDIFNITSVSYIVLTKNETITPEITEKLESLTILFQRGFYFSYDMDLTMNFQKRIKSLLESSVKSKSSTNRIYHWNYTLSKELIEQGLDCVIPVIIHGYINILCKSLADCKNKLKLAIISRKSTKNPYPYYCFESMNDQGFVSNFVETEQIFYFKKYLLSWVQIKGLCPLVFKHQANESYPINIIQTKSQGESKKVFIKHLKNILKDFNFIYFLNFLQKENSNEVTLKESLEKLLNIKEINQIVKSKYIEIDEKNKNRELGCAFEGILKILENFKFFAYNFDEKKILNEQVGVFRSSSYFDSFSNSDEFQGLLSNEIFKNFVKFIIFKVDARPLYVDKIIDVTGNVSEEPLLNWSKHTFDENSKQLDQLYMTESTKMKLNKKFIFDTLFTRQIISDYNNELEIFIGTWNFAGNLISENLNLIDWISPLQREKTPDIYVIGLQEIVKLNAKNIVFENNTEMADCWTKHLTKIVSTIDEYEKVASLDLVGIYHIVFIKKKLFPLVQNINTLVSKTGFLNALGNKGNLIVRFDINYHSFTFALCHLAAGLKKNDIRVKELNELLDKEVPVTSTTTKKFHEHDIAIIFGDLNFRIELDNPTARGYIEKGNIEELLKKDQFLKIQRNRNIPSFLIEGEIKFNPTYKFNVGTNNYDTTKKYREPAYCDRILFKRNHMINQLAYNSVDLFFSDHKPIFSIIQVDFQTIPVSFSMKQSLLEIPNTKSIFSNNSANGI